MSAWRRRAWAADRTGPRGRRHDCGGCKGLNILAQGVALRGTRGRLARRDVDHHFTPLRVLSSRCPLRLAPVGYEGTASPRPLAWASSEDADE